MGSGVYTMQAFSISHHHLTDVSLQQALGAGKASKTHSLRVLTGEGWGGVSTGRGEEPLSAWVQLRGQLQVTSFQSRPPNTGIVMRLNSVENCFCLLLWSLIRSLQERNLIDLKFI